MFEVIAELNRLLSFRSFSIKKNIVDPIYCASEVSERRSEPGANPTIASYNASAVKIYSATNSKARF
jgi:hypothetical protein